LFFLDGYIFKITSLNGHILKNSGGGEAARRLCKEGEEYARERKREERKLRGEKIRIKKLFLNPIW
jgi:hypothetical protein